MCNGNNTKIVPIYIIFSLKVKLPVLCLSNLKKKTTHKWYNDMYANFGFIFVFEVVAINLFSYQVTW